MPCQKIINSLFNIQWLFMYIAGSVKILFTLLHSILLAIQQFLIKIKKNVIFRRSSCILKKNCSSFRHLKTFLFLVTATILNRGLSGLLEMILKGRLWYLMPLSTIFQSVSFIGGVNQSTWRKPQTCRKFYHIKLHRVHLTTSRIWTNNFSGERHCLHRYL